MSAVTIGSIDARIDSVDYLQIPGTTLTICIITMVNGYHVIGESACVNPDDFDKEVGESMAYNHAFDQIWPLEGYLAAERRYQESIREDGNG